MPDDVVSAESLLSIPAYSEHFLPTVIFRHCIVTILLHFFVSALGSLLYGPRDIFAI